MPNRIKECIEESVEELNNICYDSIFAKLSESEIERLLTIPRFSQYRMLDTFIEILEGMKTNTTSTDMNPDVLCDRIKDQTLRHVIAIIKEAKV